MNYGELRTRFKAILNRRDCTDALANSFIGLGIQKIQRTLRIPAFETTLTTTASGSVSTVTIPTDFIALKHHRTSQVTLDRLEIGDFLRYSQNAEAGEHPQFFCRESTVWKIWPSLSDGSSLTTVYYAEDDSLVSDVDESTLSIVAPDLIIYAALVFAADYFADDRIAAWTQLYQASFDEVQAQATDEEWSGSPMAVSPMYVGAEF